MYDSIKTNKKATLIIQFMDEETEEMAADTEVIEDIPAEDEE